MSPELVIEQVLQANLRGLGGVTDVLA